MLQLAASVLTGCGGTAAATSASGPAGGPPALVRVSPVEERPVPPRVSVVGSIIPRHTSVVASGADGQVTSFKVDVGQRVDQGTVLSELRMESTDLEIDRARSMLKERDHELAELEAGSREEDIAEANAKMLMAKAVMENTTSRLQRIDSLFRRNAVNKEEFDEATEKAEAAKQAYAAMEALAERMKNGPRKEQIEQSRSRRDAQKEQVDWLLAEREKRITRAPFKGFVVKEMTYVGQWLSKGDPVVHLVELNEVDVVVNVDQAELSNIQLGKSANVQVRGATPSEWKGKIVSLVPYSEWKSGSRGFPVRVRLSNRIETVDGEEVPALKEGMMAEVTFEGPPVQALVVPKDALVRTSRGILVYLFVPDAADPKGGSVRMVPVETGLSDSTSIQIRGEGIVAGAQVVTTGAERLRPFQNVTILPSEEKK